MGFFLMANFFPQKAIVSYVFIQRPGVDLGGGVKAKIKLFRNMVMLHIKLKVIEHSAP